MTPIHLRNLPPPVETFDHINFFDMMMSWIKPECYIELGVREGVNFEICAKHAKKAIGVDIIPAKRPLQPNMEYHQMTTDEYFNQLDPELKFDVAFIDADHSYEQSLKDFNNIKDRIIEDGFIFLHDTYPYDPSMFDPGMCNDVYRTALHIKTHFIDEFEVVTLPFNPGVTIVKKMRKDKQLIYL
jgi:hypothetical protein